MDIVVEKLQPLSKALDRIQRVLALEFVEIETDEDADGNSFPIYPQFATTASLGRVGLLGTLLGMLWGVHVMGMMVCGCLYFWSCSFDSENDNPSTFIILAQHPRLCMLTTWCFYIASLSSFHLLEFFVTAIYNPTVLSSESYLINHSKAYTAAFLLASCEFWMRFLLFPATRNILLFTLLGIVLTILSQMIRSTAMATCGESFNHFIQTSKKDNHFLIKRGIYQYLRHPSYVGFWYFAIGTQMVLGNYLSTFLFALAGWSFFSRRIPYEEKSLIHHFGDEYFEYAQSTYMGIPFISNRGLVPEESENENSESEEGVEQVWTKVDGVEGEAVDATGDVKKTQ